MDGYVCNLLGGTFDAACARLLAMASADARPHLLVGIRTGGLVVAEAMARSTDGSLPVLPLTSRRAGTGAKSRIKVLPMVLRHLPRPVVDRLRVAEHRLLSQRRRGRNQQQHVDSNELAQICRFLDNAPRNATVLVVDDAVDSGVTLAAVLRRLRDQCRPDLAIRSAVVTVTLNNPLAEPDYTLYRGVLCRFPWSFDAAH